MTTHPLETTRNPRRRHHIRTTLAGLALLGVGLSAQAGVDVRAPFTHVGVGHGGVGVQAPFTNVQVGHHQSSRDKHYGHHYQHDYRRNHGRDSGHRYDRDLRSRAHYDRHDNRRYGARDHRDGRYDRRYADQHNNRHHDNNRGGFFGRW